MNAFRLPRCLAIAAVSTLFAVLCFAAPARTAALLYTFEGTTSDYTVPPPNYLPPGEPVSYTFLIDFERAGTSSIDGVVTTKVDDAQFDYFFVKFISGTNLYPRPPVEPPYTYSANYGFDDTVSDTGWIFGSPTEYKYNSVVISSGFKVSEWEVGYTMIGEDSVGAYGDPDFAWTVSSLELTSITAVPEPATEIEELMADISDLPAAAFKNKNMGKALNNKLNAVLWMLDQEDYAEALEKLQNDILKKTDGCAMKGMRDSNDWIKECNAQGQIYPAVVDIIALLQLLSP